MNYCIMSMNLPIWCILEMLMVVSCNLICFFKQMNTDTTEISNDHHEEEEEEGEEEVQVVQPQATASSSKKKGTCQNK